MEQERAKFLAELGASGFTGTNDLHTSLGQLIDQPLHMRAFAGAIDAL
jgi:hypothetical protein